jgi:hypothetical protein
VFNHSLNNYYVQTYVLEKAVLESGTDPVSETCVTCLYMCCKKAVLESGTDPVSETCVTCLYMCCEKAVLESGADPVSET